MECGVDVISEKAMAVDAGQVQRILDTRRRTGRKLRVTFNYRYAPPATQLKHLLMSGVIGEVLSVDFHWLLNTSHGADYFRRWHRRKANSGGLQVHKATHHFDLINWMLSDVPETVYAEGGLRFYTPATAERYGLARRGARCQGCPEAAGCPFYLDIAAYPDMKMLYLDNEQYDGYYRDQCVFSADTDIEDTLHAVISYRGGVQMSYSLHAYMPWEGLTIAFNGSKGRLEHVQREAVYLNGDGSVPGELLAEETHTRIIPYFQNGYTVENWTGEGGHGGGDPLLLAQLFDPAAPADPYMRRSDERGGAWSVLVGAAINRSLLGDGRLSLSEMVDGLDLPDYPPMPSSAEPLDAAGQLGGRTHPLG
jgi:predicted dehydrogenase